MGSFLNLYFFFSTKSSSLGSKTSWNSLVKSKIPRYQPPRTNADSCDQANGKSFCLGLWSALPARRETVDTHALWSDSIGLPYSVLHQAPLSLFSLLCIKTGGSCMMVMKTLPDLLIRSFLWLRSYAHFELLLPPPNWALCSNLLSHLMQILHYLLARCVNTQLIGKGSFCERERSHHKESSC